MNRIVVLIAVLACAPATVSANPSLERAREQLQDLRYEGAKKSLRSALKAGKNSAAVTAEIYKLLGEVHAALGETKASVENFRNALILDAKTKLGEGVSPKISEPFEEAEKFVAEKGRLLAETKIVSTSPPKVALVVTSDPAKMIVKVTAAYRIGEAESVTTVKARGKSKVVIPLPAGTVGARLTAFDRYGNRIVELGEKALPKPGNKPPKGDDDDGDDDDGELDLNVSDGTGDGGSGGQTDTGGGGRPIYAHWALYGGLAVAAAGAGVAFGLSAQSSLDELDDLKAMSETVEFTAAKEVEDKARSRALFANIAFGAAAGLAAASAVLFFTRGSSSSKERSALVPTVTSDSIGMTALFDF